MYVSVHVNLSVCAGVCVHVWGYWDKSKVVCGMCVGVSVWSCLSVCGSSLGWKAL